MWYQEFIIEKRVSNFHIATLWKMSSSNNSVYSIVFMYNPYVLTRPYQHLTFVALIRLHQIMCISWHFHCRIWRQCLSVQNGYPYKPSEMNLPPYNKSFLAFWWTFCSVQAFQHHAIKQHCVIFHSNRAFYYENIYKQTVSLLLNYKYSLPFVTVQILCLVCSLLLVILTL